MREKLVYPFFFKEVYLLSFEPLVSNNSFVYCELLLLLLLLPYVYVTVYQLKIARIIQTEKQYN